MCKKNNNKQREFWTETLNVVCKSLIAWFDCLFTRELHLQLFVGILDLSLKVLLTFCQYFHGLLNIWLHICQYRQIHLLTIQLLCILVECTIFHEKEICYFMSKRHTRKSPKFVNKAKLLLEVLNVLHHHFYLPEVDIQVQNGKGVLGSLVSSILDMGLACLGSMAILDLYIYFR